MGNLLYITKDSFELPPGGKVIKAQHYSELLEARDALAKAQDRAQEIIAEAQKVYASEKERGYQEGLEEGKEEIATRLIDAAGKVVDYFASVEDKLTEVVFKATEKILGELKDRELVVRTVKNALLRFHNQKDVTLRVNPEEEEAVKGKLKEILLEFPEVQFIDVQGDGRIQAGGCLLECGAGVVDARIETQLAALKKSLRKGFLKAQ